VVTQYYSDNYLQLKDGWCLFQGEYSKNSVANFPVQGHGASILRKAVERCILAGLSPIAPLHDCIYIVTSIDKEEKDKKLLESCMRQAVIDVCGEDFIRVDLKTHTTDWTTFKSTYTEDKGANEFKEFGKYMISQEKTAEENIVIDLDGCGCKDSRGHTTSS
jgi:hypothetical protein